MKRLPGFSGIFQFPQSCLLFSMSIYVVDDWHVAVQSRYPFNNNIMTQVLTFFFYPSHVCLFIVATYLPTMTHSYPCVLSVNWYPLISSCASPSFPLQHGDPSIPFSACNLRLVFLPALDNIVSHFQSFTPLSTMLTTLLWRTSGTFECHWCVYAPCSWASLHCRQHAKQCLQNICDRSTSTLHR